MLSNVCSSTVTVWFSIANEFDWETDGMFSEECYANLAHSSY